MLRMKNMTRRTRMKRRNVKRYRMKRKRRRRRKRKKKLLVARARRCVQDRNTMRII
jgi:hypothetical protein